MRRVRTPGGGELPEMERRHSISPSDRPHGPDADCGAGAGSRTRLLAGPLAGRPAGSAPLLNGQQGRDLNPDNVIQAEAGVVEDIVVAFDPGLARAGVAVARLRPLSEGGEEPFEPIALGCWATEKSAKKLDVLASNDDFRRAREQAGRLDVLLRRKPCRVRYLAVEAMSFPRNARTSAQIAMFWGALAHACMIGAFPVVQASPQQIRARLGVQKKQPKDAVHAALVRRFGARAIARLLGDLTKEERNHPLDALAALVASEESEIFRLARR